MTHHDVQIKSLSYQNILSVGNNPITIDFSDCHNLLITGENGSGKSATLSALSYNFYGKTDRDLNKSEIINNINGKELYTETTLLINGKTYVIERGLKPDILRVSIDGVYLHENASKLDLDKIIVDILGCDYQTFYKLVVISKTNYTSILNMKPPERRTFVQNILDIGVFTDMQLLVKERIKEAKKEITLVENTITNKQSYIDRDISRLEQSKTTHATNITSHNEQLEYLINIEMPRLTAKKLQDVEAIENEIKLLDSNDTTEIKAKIQSDIIDAELKLVHLKADLKNNAYDQSHLDSLTKKHTQEKIVLDNMNAEYSKLNVKLNITLQDGKNIKTQLDSLNNNSACPTCKITLTNDDLKNELESKRNTLLDNYNTQKDAYQKYKENVDNQTIVVNDLVNKIEQYNQKKGIVQNLDREINNVNRSIELLKEKDVDGIKNTKIHVLKERLNSLQDKDYLYEVNLKIGMVEKTLSDLKNKGFDDLEKSIEMDTESLEATKLEHETLLEDLKYQQYLSVILDDKGIKSNIMDIYIPFLNARINYYLDKLGFFMYFEMDKNFQEVLKKDFRHECSYNNLSEGEKQRVDLSIMFAFRDIARSKNYASFNVLFLDDMTGHIDNDGVDKVLELIEQEQQDTVTVMINHDSQKYSGIFDKVITFEKKNNFTVMVKQDL